LPEHESSQAFFRILSLDGGGIRGVFPAALLAKLEEHFEYPIGRYFDLIAGTSTGGIIAIGLGMGLSAREILRFYEERGPAIFDQHRRPVFNWIARRWRGARHWFDSKYETTELRAALNDVLGTRRLGESQTRLLIPAWDALRERVYIYKTSHHSRLEVDYLQPAIDAAMATAAAPTFLPPYTTADHVELVDGGVWANNPVGLAAVEAIGLLKWPADKIKILSIGTITDFKALPQWGGKLPMAANVTRLFMAGQSHSALGTAKILTGHGGGQQAIWRIDQTAPTGRYSLDNTRMIAEMKSRGVAEAREQLAELRRHFFSEPAPTFEPVFNLGGRR